MGVGVGLGSRCQGVWGMRELSTFPLPDVRDHQASTLHTAGPGAWRGYCPNREEHNHAHPDLCTDTRGSILITAPG